MIEFQRARAIGGISIIYVDCIAFQKEQGRKEEDEEGRKYFTLHILRVIGGEGMFRRHGVCWAGDDARGILE